MVWRNTGHRPFVYHFLTTFIPFKWYKNGQKMLEKWSVTFFRQTIFRPFFYHFKWSGRHGPPAPKSGIKMVPDLKVSKPHGPKDHTVSEASQTHGPQDHMSWQPCKPPAVLGRLSGWPQACTDSALHPSPSGWEVLECP